MAGQLFKRLEAEGKNIKKMPTLSLTVSSGFIEQDTVQTTEESPFLETTTRKTRAKARGAKSKQAVRGKSFQKSKYTFRYSMKTSKKYRDYFTPTPEVERKVLGLADLVIPFSLVISSYMRDLCLETRSQVTSEAYHRHGC